MKIKIILSVTVVLISAILLHSSLFYKESNNGALYVYNDYDYEDIKAMIEKERRHYIASVCDAVCPSSPYLCKVAFCGMMLSRCEDDSFPNTAAEAVSTDPLLRDAQMHDFSRKPSDSALMAYDDAYSGFSPCPDALYYCTLSMQDITLVKHITLFEIGKHVFLK